MASSDLKALVAAELAEPVDPRAAAMAAALAAEYPGAARAVLFYGSCLRQRELEGLMLDFYLIVSSYADAYPKKWLRTANRLIPPNVFPFAHDRLIAKYAVLSEADFARECSPAARSVSVWARFAQPSRLVWAANGAARERAAATVAEAPPTLFRMTLPLLPPDGDPLDVWRKGFSLTYAAELRAERSDRSGGIVEADCERYARLSAPVMDAIAGQQLESPGPLRRRWRRLQRKGKALTLIRLLKASGTYAGGVDYLAWKINRHAGTKIEVKPWQRRWPLVAGLILLPRLLKRGAIR
ncbi:MAG TPA: hypothetical protein VHM92_05955 [Allosphingosinicella sp.]|nr:hypothetical protein [Allosphingosinicella sp.]